MWVYVLVLAFVCEAHVRLLHKPYFTLPIRNAASASADGALSVAGPCGGILQWGNRSFYSNVTEGQNLTLVFGYNGGHQSSTLNMLRVSMICGKPQTDILHKNTTVAKVSSPLVNASASLTSGYDVWVIIPAIQPGLNGHLCTISVLDVRNWGGCVDVQILSATAATPTPVPAQNALVGANIAGVYDFAQAQCTPDSPGCCCLSGKLTVVHATGATTATATAVLNSCGNTTVSKALDATAAVTLTQQASTLASLRGTVNIASSTLSLQISAGATNTLVVTDDSPAPIFCGFESRLGASSPTPRSGGGGGASDNSSASTIGSGIAAFMLAVFFSQ